LWCTKHGMCAVLAEQCYRFIKLYLRSSYHLLQCWLNLIIRVDTLLFWHMYSYQWKSNLESSFLSIRRILLQHSQTYSLYYDFSVNRPAMTGFLEDYMNGNNTYVGVGTVNVFLVSRARQKVSVLGNISMNLLSANAQTCCSSEYYIWVSHPGKNWVCLHSHILIEHSCSSRYSRLCIILFVTSDDIET
jgi:hypothetical protein